MGHNICVQTPCVASHYIFFKCIGAFPVTRLCEAILKANGQWIKIESQIGAIEFRIYLLRLKNTDFGFRRCCLLYQGGPVHMPVEALVDIGTGCQTV